MYCVRGSNSKLELFYQLFIELFLAYFFDPKLKHLFERSLKLLLHIPKEFIAFYVLTWFSFLLRFTCVIFARAINTDIWQAFVVRTTGSQKNCSKPCSVGFWE